MCACAGRARDGGWWVGGGMGLVLMLTKFYFKYILVNKIDLYHTPQPAGNWKDFQQ